MVVKTTTYMLYNPESSYQIGNGTSMTQLPVNESRIALPMGYISSEKLDSLPMNTELNGSWGPIAWDIDYNIDVSDLTNSFFKVKINLFGIHIINTTIDKDNTKINVDLSVSGVGIVATLGVDFINRRLYFSGDLNFVVYIKKFDITLLKF
ncbi:hypothetical protein [Clostridium tarantellae]|uniref:Uncharacterized protein n=1 Tax=Clostridium tarantellae TaxID=39493 RepID=A0A6I1MLY4_9CLOT|nr:hypothetical protein [Clostridium tarantellae]MPQ44010.1 hypothetical protein [Clostridium tarantellae]